MNEKRSRREFVRWVSVAAIAGGVSEAAARPLQVSGIYPHLSMFNSDPKRGRPEPECGIGAVVPWAGKLWCMTYTSHALGRGSDKLYSVSPELVLEERPESVGGTHACRMIHRESKQLFIGCYAVDAAGKVRAIVREDLPGRLTALARHNSDPANKVLYLAQEGAVYEVDVHTLQVRELFKKPLPGWHYKGAWTAQGRLFVSANGEEPAPSPFWKVDYSSAATRQITEELSWQYLQVPHPPLAAARSKGQTMWGGLSEDIGNLGEWDGKAWRVLSRRQHLDISGPGGLNGAGGDEEPVWALGWDLRSAFVKVRDKAGDWSVYRVPKASYSADGINGSNTEWPRICEVGAGERLMFLHNGLFDFPAGFRKGRSGGLRQIASTLVTVTDMTSWQGGLVFSQQATSVHGLARMVPGQPQSNLQFLGRNELPAWGPAEGRGGVWVEDAVKANTPSDPFLIAGYRHRCLHLENQSDGSVGFMLEADGRGDERWRSVRRVEVPAKGTLSVQLPEAMKAQWLRVKTDRDCVATAFFHVASPRQGVAGEGRIFDGLAAAGEKPRHSGIVRAGFPTRNLQLLTTDGRYFEVNEKLEFQPVESPKDAALLRNTHALEKEWLEDAASVMVLNYDGQRYRLPKGDGALSGAGESRGVRECIQERYLANFHGTFYEVPRGKGNRPDYQRMKAVATHNRCISDFCTWRGMLVMSGVKASAGGDGHVFGEAGAKLWFGAIDDLWKMGKPRGSGGPWKDAAVRAGDVSEPYLLAGYDEKTLRLSHDAGRAIQFLVEVDYYADGQWHLYEKLSVGPGKPLVHPFPAGYGAHWLRVRASEACTASAQLEFA